MEETNKCIFTFLNTFHIHGINDLEGSLTTSILHISENYKTIHINKHTLTHRATTKKKTIICMLLIFISSSTRNGMHIEHFSYIFQRKFVCKSIPTHSIPFVDGKFSSNIPLLILLNLLFVTPLPTTQRFVYRS